MLSRMLAVCRHFRSSGKDSFVTIKCAFGELDGQEDCGLSYVSSPRSGQPVTKPRVLWEKS